MRRLCTLLAVIFCGTTIVVVMGPQKSSGDGQVGISQADICDVTDKDDDDSIEDWMEKVHKGRRSPLKQVTQALAQDAPNWDLVTNQLLSFVTMSQKLKQSKNKEIRDSSDGYVDAVTSLVEKSKVRDLAASRKALRALNSSCADCHFKGGVGGDLDD